MKSKYRTRAIITRGFWRPFLCFQGGFSKNYVLCMVTIQERIVMARVRYLFSALVMWAIRQRKTEPLFSLALLERERRRALYNSYHMVTNYYRHCIQYSHCFFRIMNIKRKGTFQFCFPGLLGIHSNPNWKEIFEMLWILFEKILSLYFDCPKSWIWRNRDVLWIFLGYGTFILLQKKFFDNFFFF